MQVQIDIAFNQLIQVVRSLTPFQLKQLQAEVEKELLNEKQPLFNLETVLLNGPEAIKKQLELIAKNKAAIS